MSKIISLNHLGGIAISLAAISFAPNRVQAQRPFDPDPLPPLQPAPSFPPERTEPPLQLQPSPEIEPEPEPTGTRAITVKQFRFVGNTVFSNEELAKITAPFVGREITFAELLQARSAITQLYIDNGYTTSGAYLPPGAKNKQLPIQGAVVTIQVREGQLGEISITGGDRLHGYVRSRLQAAASGALNVDKLLEALRLLQSDPLFEQISTVLTQTADPTVSNLEVRLRAANPLTVEPFVNNYRSPGVGTLERGIEFNHANLIGLGDNLLLRYRNTDGSHAGEVSYEVPVNPQNGTLSFDFAIINSKIVEEPFSQLDILSDYRSYELAYRQPLIRRATEKATQEFAVGLSAFRSESESSLLDTPFPISSGADDQGRSRINALRFFQDWSRQSNQEIFSARSQFSFGLDILDSTIKSEGPDSQFFAWRGQAAWFRRLPLNLLLRTKADLQLSPTSLPPVEQFTLGGFNTVRGYRQDLLLGDNGFQASVELGIPIFSKSYGDLELFPFFDVGTAWNRSGSIDPNTLASTGIGLQYRLGRRFSARIDWGIPLVNVNTGGNSWQEEGLTFSIRYQQPL